MSEDPRKAGPGSRADDSDSWSDVTLSGKDLERARPEPAASQDDGSSQVAVARIRGLRVMVLGGDDERLHVISEALHRLKVKVAVGGHDEEGYRTGLAFRPDVVVSEPTRPGQAGWWLFQRFRRHPMLRWVPVLLMSWWDETGARGKRVSVDRVVERIADALAPSRIIEDRIRAGGVLADRVETTSVLVLAKVFTRNRVLGTLTVNDSWNVFEVGFRNGGIDFASRRGVDGEEDLGGDAFFQFLMCDTGRWSFKSQTNDGRRRNIGVSVEELLDSAWRKSAAMVGPDARPLDPEELGLTVRPQLFHEIASTLGGAAREVVEAMGSGISKGELEPLISDEEDRPEIERAISNLVRSGALLPAPPSDTTAEVDLDSRVAGRVRQVLHWIAEDHGARRSEEDKDQWGPDGPTRSGYYKMSRPIEEAVRLGRADGMMAPGAVRPSMAVDGPLAGYGDPGDRPTPVISEEEMAHRSEFQDGPARRDSRENRVLAHDSLVPGPRSMERRMKRQMWLAIALAIILGGLLVAGLLIIDSGGREVPEEVDRR